MKRHNSNTPRTQCSTMKVESNWDGYFLKKVLDIPRSMTENTHYLPQD